MHGRNAVSASDLLPVYHCLWNEPEEQNGIRDIVIHSLFNELDVNLVELNRVLAADLKVINVKAALKKMQNKPWIKNLKIVNHFYFQLENHGTGHTYIYAADFLNLSEYNIKNAPIQGVMYQDPRNKNQTLIRTYAGVNLERLSNAENINLRRKDDILYINGVEFKLRHLQRGEGQEEINAKCLVETNRDYGKEIPKSARIECYMNTHRHDDNANDLLFFYKSVIDWVNDIFFHNYTPNSYQSLASQDWARMYIEYHNYTEGFTEDKKIHITERCKFYIGMGSDLYSKSDGIYEWVLRGEKKEEEYMIHVRAFKPEDRRRMYNAQGGYDPISGKKCDITEMHGHHIKPWRLGGATDYFNLVMLSEETHNNLDILGLSPEDILMKRDELIKKNQASKL
jgi:hypothetical protein